MRLANEHLDRLLDCAVAVAVDRALARALEGAPKTETPAGSRLPAGADSRHHDHLNDGDCNRTAAPPTT